MLQKEPCRTECRERVFAVTCAPYLACRLDEALQVGECLAAEELNLDNRIAECKAKLADLSA